ncbi:MAG TPA: hypothetical protein VJQ47_13470, partial [Steroidobacteraceae bacterium]|nr:hypothetical protein [Steroidobacteraceae bacterium]
LRVYEAAAIIDGSVGWAVMIGSGGGLFAAYLAPDAAQELFGPADALIAGSGSPDGRADSVAGGYRVAGRWKYASGAHYATTFTANCVLYRDGQPLRGASGEPVIRAMSFPTSEVTIVPTWDAGGMRGTGSHDFEVRNSFVAEQRTFSVLADAPREPGVLYRLPFAVLTELPVTAVAVGIARHALEAFAAFAASKRVRFEGGSVKVAGHVAKAAGYLTNTTDSPPSLGPHSPCTLADEADVQRQYAESHARYSMVHSHLYSLARDCWETVATGGTLTAVQLAEISAGCALGVAELHRAIGDLARLAGMTAILGESEFARAWRDLQTLGAHISVSSRQFTTAGQALLKTRVAALPMITVT